MQRYAGRLAHPYERKAQVAGQGLHQLEGVFYWPWICLQEQRANERQQVFLEGEGSLPVSRSRHLVQAHEKRKRHVGGRRAYALAAEGLYGHEDIVATREHRLPARSRCV